MKILVICQYYYPEPFKVHDLCEALVSEGHEVDVITSFPNYPMGEIYEGYKNGEHKDEVLNGVNVHRVFTIGRRTGFIWRVVNYYTYSISSTLYVSKLKKEYDKVFVYQLSPVMMANAAIKYKKKHNKKYDTPKNIGEKGQMDVKYVPDKCKSPKIAGYRRFYQYTYIDETTRERFLYWYEEHTPMNTVDFVLRVIKYFGYKPNIIQTDNGMEFCFFRDVKRIHPLDKLCNELNIEHKRIKPRTPSHNGKVERSHRNDQERFYNYLKFYSKKIN